jgi:hypothetical protein
LKRSIGVDVRIRSFVIVGSLCRTACAALLASAASACGSASDTTAAPAPTATHAPAAPAPLAADELAIDEVAVYQAVKVTVVKGGAVVKKLNAPIIAGRPAFVRVFVKAIGRTRPKIEGELRVTRAGKEDLLLRDSGRGVLPVLDDALLDQTLNFEIPAEDMTADATFSVKAGVKLASGDVVAFPDDGTSVPFTAKTASQKLRVTFVPVAYQSADGTSLTPDLADTATLKDTLFKMYPVAAVEITVHAPLKWSTPVAADGPGWNSLLAGIMQVRKADNVDRDVYYVGVFTPKPTIDQFCDQGSCILGIAPQADEKSVGLRAALVLGYANRSAGGTLAQELAHAMGRAHAPCGNPQAIDDQFPYAGGSIGVFGYDLITKELLDPGDRWRDFMSYCSPVWTSDYTFQGIYDRMEIVTTQQKAAVAAAAAASGATGSGKSEAQLETYQSFIVAADGTIEEGPAIDVLPGESSGEQIAIAYEGASGNVIANAHARVRSISSTGGRIVIAPRAPSGATRVRVAGIGVSRLASRAISR